MSDKQKSGSENKKRSFIKAISWRLVAITILGTVSYILTGDLEETTLIVVVYNVIQIFVYFLHERLWDSIKWGKREGIDQMPPADDLSPEELEVIQERLKQLGYIEWVADERLGLDTQTPDRVGSL